MNYSGYNNIILNNHTWRGCIAAEAITSFNSDCNIVNDKLSNVGDGSTITLAQWQALGLGQHSTLANSVSTIFEAPSSDNYHLKIGSQAIDADTASVNSIVVVDIDENTRPDGSAFDIGVYGYQGSSSIQAVDERQISLYPNPFNNEIYLSNTTSKNLEYVLVDVTGKQLRKEKINNNQIVLNDLTKGTYFIKIRNSNNEIICTKQIIKK